MDSFRNIPASPSEFWKDAVATASALPSLSNNIGDTRQALDTNVIYTWNGTAWISVASPGGSATAIDQLLGDVLATGPGAVTATLKTVNLNVGGFGTATSVPTINVNEKGLVTSASNTSIQIAQSQVTNLSTDLAGKFNNPTGTSSEYIRGDGTIATLPSTFLDDSFRIQDSTTPTKQIAFEASSITAGQTRTLTVPDASGRLQIEGRAIGDVTPANGTFTTLTANTRIIGPQGASVGSASNAAISLGANNTGLWIQADEVVLTKASNKVWQSLGNIFDVMSSSGLRINSPAAPLQFTNDISLIPVSSGQLHQRSSTTPQSFLPYNTYTNDGVYERAFLRWNSNKLEIGTEKAGTGINRPINIIQNGRVQIEINDAFTLINSNNGKATLKSNTTSNQTRELFLPNASGVIGLERYESDVGDFYNLQSYGYWANGKQTDFEGTSKWDNIANSGSPGWINLRLAFAMVNGKTIPENLINQEEYVDASSIYFIDYGYGLSEANYTEFFNGIFATFNLETQLFSKGDYTWIASYCKLDNFYFVFEETGFIDDGGGGNIFSPCFYILSSNGPILADGIAQSLGDSAPYNQIINGNLRFWSIV